MSAPASDMRAACDRQRLDIACKALFQADALGELLQGRLERSADLASFAMLVRMVDLTRAALGLIDWETEPLSEEELADLHLRVLGRVPVPSVNPALAALPG